MGLKKSTAFNSSIFPSLFTTSSMKTDWLYTLRGRVGYAWNDWLLFATGGLAVTRAEFTETYSDVFAGFGVLEFSNGSTKKTMAGWTGGAGVERVLGNNLTGKIEYLYADFGKISTSAPIITLGTPNGITMVSDARLTVHIVRVGLNYKFSAAP